MHSVGLKPSAHSFTALLTAATTMDTSHQHSAAVACLLRQMAGGKPKAAGPGGAELGDVTIDVCLTGAGVRDRHTSEDTF